MREDKPRLVERYPLVIPGAVATLFLLGALAEWPYGYYRLVRIVVCGACVWVGLFAHAQKRGWAVAVFTFIAVLFNPVLPIHLTRQIWLPIDLITAALFVLASFTVTERHGESGERE